MNVQVSIGEAIDKYTLLELKSKQITAEDALSHVRVELNILAGCRPIIEKHWDLYRMLTYVNTYIWETSNAIKVLSPVWDPIKYAKLADRFFEYNQFRFRLKQIFNTMTGSTLKDQSPDAPTKCVIGPVPLHKLAELAYLALSYDLVVICATSCVGVPAWMSHRVMFDPSQTPAIDILQFKLPDDIPRDVFEPMPITYVSGGLLGDFIHQLSVIHQYYLTTGRKGILYLANIGDEFRMGLQKTFEDTATFISELPYIHTYKIYENEPVEVNLSGWRQYKYLLDNNWHEIFKTIYQVQWGTIPWITAESVDPAWKSKILINTVPHRFPTHVDFHALSKEVNSERLVFIGFNQADYDDFIIRTQLADVPFHKLTSFKELITIIGSASLLISGYSGVMAMAMAMHKPCVAGNGSSRLDRFYHGLNTIIQSIYYSQAPWKQL